MRKGLFVIFIFMTTYSFSQDYSIGASFRTRFRSSYNTSIMPTTITNLKDYYTVNSNAFNFSIDFEIPQKKFFHLINTKYYFDKNIIDRVVKNSDTLKYEYSRNGFYDEYTLAYGIGKYFPIYKSNIYLVLSNSLFSTIKRLHYDKQEGTTYDFDNNKILYSTVEKIDPYIFDIGYEVKPTLLYRFKFIALSLSLPAYLYATTSNGDRISTKIDTDLLTNETVTKTTTFYQDYTTFFFRYDLELGIKFYIKKKKKK